MAPPPDITTTITHTRTRTIRIITDTRIHITSRLFTTRPRPQPQSPPPPQLPVYRIQLDRPYQPQQPPGRRHPCDITTITNSTTSTNILRSFENGAWDRRWTIIQS